MTALHQAIAARIAQFPGRTAVASGRSDISYAELQNQIAALQDKIAGKHAVGILSTRTLEAYVAVLACFFSGIRFVPMNPALPRERLATIADAGGVELVTCDTSSTGQAEQLAREVIDISEMVSNIGPEAGLIRHAEVDPADIAYQMFTSGSTGAPKGVPISYASLSHYVLEITRCLQMPEGGRYSQLFDLSFDLSMHDIFVALANGGTIVPAGPIDLMMPHKYVEKKQIDHWFSVPVLAMLAARGQGQKAPDWQLRTALFCGEALPTDYAENFRQFVAPDGPLFNLYGPTEATIAFTAKKFDPAQTGFATVPLGEAFGDNVIAIETDDGQIRPVEEGVTGELLLGGPQVFAGYDPALGDEMFTVGDQGRFYRSGDLVEVTKGELIHLGRKDSQIKLHGYRIELGEIEAMFRRMFGCASAAAIMVGAGEQGRIVVAYEHTADIADLAPLREFLPDYMIPDAILRLETMPTNVNGKIDRKSLANLQWPA